MDEYDSDYWEEAAKEEEQFKDAIKESFELHKWAGGTREEFINTLIPIDHEKESNYYNYSDPENRRQIVKQYHEDKKKGKATNQDAWADKYGISGRTLRNYIKEFPEII